MNNKTIGAITATIEFMMEDLIAQYPLSIKSEIDFQHPEGDYESEFTGLERQDIERRAANFIYALAGYEQLLNGQNLEYIKGLQNDHQKQTPN